MRSVSIACASKPSWRRTVSFSSFGPDRLEPCQPAQCCVSRRRAQRHDPFDVERRAGQDEERVHGRETAQLDFPQSGNRVEPPKRPLDPGPRLLTDRVAGMARRTPIDRAPAASCIVLRDMRRYVDLAHLVDEVGGVIGLVGADGALPRWRKPPMVLSIVVAASRSAKPSATVACASTISP